MDQISDETWRLPQTGDTLDHVVWPSSRLAAREFRLGRGRGGVVNVIRQDRRFAHIDRAEKGLARTPIHFAAKYLQ